MILPVFRKFSIEMNFSLYRSSVAMDKLFGQVLWFRLSGVFGFCVRFSLSRKLQHCSIVREKRATRGGYKLGKWCFVEIHGAKYTNHHGFCIFSNWFIICGFGIK